MAGDSQQDTTGHALPKWFDALQMHLMLPMLLLAEGVINGRMMSLGIGFDTPEHQIETTVMYFAGFLMGGMALRCSATAAQAFQRREIMFFLINFLGIFLFAMPEIWSSLVIRGQNLPVNGPDTWLLGLLSAVGSSITPSNAFVSVGLPLVTIFWGFASRKRAPLSAQELAAIEANKTIKARGKAERRLINVQSLGQSARAGFDAITNKSSDESDAMDTGANPTDLSSQMSAAGDGVSGDKYGAPRGNLRVLPAGGTLPKTYVKAEDILAYVQTELGWKDLDISSVKAWMVQQPKAFRADGDNAAGISLPGAPYIMLKSTAFAAAKRKWPLQAIQLEIAD